MCDLLKQASRTVCFTVMAKCTHLSYILLIAGFGANVVLIAWNIVDRYRYFDLHRIVEKAPNSYNLFKHFIDENILEEATNSSVLWMRFRRALLNNSAEMSWIQRTGKVSKHEVHIYIYSSCSIYVNCIIISIMLACGWGIFVQVCYRPILCVLALRTRKWSAFVVNKRQGGRYTVPV